MVYPTIIPLFTMFFTIKSPFSYGKPIRLIKLTGMETLKDHRGTSAACQACKSSKESCQWPLPTAMPGREQQVYNREQVIYIYIYSMYVCICIYIYIWITYIALCHISLSDTYIYIYIYYCIYCHFISIYYKLYNYYVKRIHNYHSHHIKAIISITFGSNVGHHM